MASEPNLPIGIPAFPFDACMLALSTQEGLPKSGGQCKRKCTIEDEIFAADEQLAVGPELLEDCHSEKSKVKERWPGCAIPGGIPSLRKTIPDDPGKTEIRLRIRNR